MNHTLQSLLPLLNAEGNPVDQEASDKLRVWAAEADGMELVPHPESKKPYWRKDGVTYAIGVSGKDLAYGCKHLPCYPESLDAIFAAEERLGLHTDRALSFNYVTLFWQILTHFSTLEGRFTVEQDLLFLTPAQRSIAFILTAQSIKK